TSKQKLFRDSATENLVLKLVLIEVSSRLHVTNNTSIITRTASLLLESMIEIDLISNSLTVCDLGLASYAIDVVLAAHALDVNIQVKFAHAGDNSLLRFRINVDAESRIFPLKA